jgi:hypothetical protein
MNYVMFIFINAVAEYKKINAQMKEFMVPSSKLKHIMKKDVDEDQEDLILGKTRYKYKRIDFNISNMTIINDMNLIISQFSEEKYFTERRNVTERKLCLVHLFNELKMTNLTNNNNTNTTNYTSTDKLVKLAEIENEDHPAVLNYFKNTNQTYKTKICSKCLDQLDLIKYVKNEVKIITDDISKHINKTISKQDVVVKISDQINKVNFIKFNTYYIKSSIKLMKELECPQYKSNHDMYKLLKKNTNTLVEGIQNSMRRKNLNLNFLIFS